MKYTGQISRNKLPVKWELMRTLHYLQANMVIHILRGQETIIAMCYPLGCLMAAMYVRKCGCMCTCTHMHVYVLYMLGTDAVCTTHAPTLKGVAGNICYKRLASMGTSPILTHCMVCMRCVPSFAHLRSAIHAVHMWGSVIWWPYPITLHTSN